MSEKKIPGAGALSVASRDVTKLLCQGPYGLNLRSTLQKLNTVSSFQGQTQSEIPTLRAKPFR